MVLKVRILGLDYFHSLLLLVKTIKRPEILMFRKRRWKSLSQDREIGERTFEGFIGYFEGDVFEYLVGSFVYSPVSFLLLAVWK